MAQDQDSPHVVSPHGLTKEDLRALRVATSAVVRVQKDGTTFELLKETKDKDGFAGSDQLRYEIPCETRSPRYHRGGYGIEILYAYSGAFQVLQRFLREGDVLSFSMGENGNGYSAAAVVLQDRLDRPEWHPGGYDRLHVDELLVTITRGGKVLVRDLVLETSVGVDNTARMIREEVR